MVTKPLPVSVTLHTSPATTVVSSARVLPLVVGAAVSPTMSRTAAWDDLLIEVAASAAAAFDDHQQAAIADRGVIGQRPACCC